MKKGFLLLSFIALLLIPSGMVKATHAMGADLTYNCLGGNNYRVRLSFYRDCSGITPFTSFTCTVNSITCAQNLTMTLNLLAGYPVEVSPLCPANLAQSTCNGGVLPGVTQYIYEGNITLPMACTDWLFYIEEGNRNNVITTLTTPGSEWLRVEARLNSIAGGCNNSPDFTTLPVPYVCLNQPYIYNHGAIDPDGDSLSYSLVNALSLGGASVVYNAPFNGLNPMTSVPPVSINPLNGNITMTPTAIQVAVIAVRVNEYRGGVLIGSVIRDIQVTVMNCTNVPPTIGNVTGVTGGNQTGPFTIEVCPGTPLFFTIPGTDPDAGQILNWTWNNGIPGGVFNGPTGPSPQNATFSWTPTAGDVGLNSLVVTLRDNACPVLGQAVRSIDIIVLQGTTVGPDLVFCNPPGNPVQLNAVGGATFTWTILSGTPGSLSCLNCPNPLATPLVPTTYAVQSNLAGLCKNRDTIVVSPAPGFALVMSPNQTLCLGGSTAITAIPAPAGSYTYNWSPGTGLNATNIQSPTANPTVTTTYNVTVTAANGCTMTGSTTVTVSNQVLSVAPTATPVQSCAGAPVTLNANVTSGNCNQYGVTSIAYAPIAGVGTTIALGDDQVSGAIALPFAFNFFCTNYNNIYICSNGFLTFDPAAPSGCCSGGVIPDVTTPNNIIAGCWNDLYPPAGGSIEYFTTGASPNRVFNVRYSTINHCCGVGPNNTFQIQLYETTNEIRIHLGNITSDGSTATCGIENSTGTTAFVAPGRNGVIWTATNEAWSFLPVTPIPYVVTWQAPLGNTIGTGASFVVTPGGTTTYYAIVSNGICSAAGSVLVDVASVNAGPDQNVCPAGGNANFNAVYTGPPPPSNCNVYTVTNIPFAPVAGAGTPVALSDDQVSGALPIGFTFQFYCNNYTQFYISSNGFIGFNGGMGSGCCGGQLFPNAGTPNDVIAAAWDDLYPPGAGSITYFTTGVSPNRRLIVNYTGIPYCCGATPAVTTQIVLYETTNIVEVHSTSINAISPGTQGIENSTGLTAVTTPGRNSSAWSATNDAYRFTPQVGALVWNWAPPTYLNFTNIANPTAVGVGGTVTYTVTVNNGTCILTDQVVVTLCLPVDNIQLTAVKAGDEVNLNWRSFNEVQLDHYVIERSIDGSPWKDIGSLKATGGIGLSSEYNSVDPFPGAGTNFYRLRLMNEDGSIEFSNQVEVTFGTGEHVSISPNPNKGTFIFEIGLTEDTDITIEIFSTEGKKVYESVQSDFHKGINNTQVELNGLADGVYYYFVHGAKGSHSGKIVIEK